MKQKDSLKQGGRFLTNPTLKLSTMKKANTLKLDNNQPFKSRIFCNLTKEETPKLNKEDLVEEEREAAYLLLDYLLNKINRNEFIGWVFGVIQKISLLPKNDDALDCLSKIAELLVKTHSQDEIIRTFNGFDIYEDGLNKIIQKISIAFYVYWNNTSDFIDSAEFDHHFKMVRHLVVLNEFYHNYYWAGKRILYLEKQSA
jgi:hypothetical protein